ncbi:MAG: galactokinase [Halieaceae bacterium]|jgi:galactokinase
MNEQAQQLCAAAAAQLQADGCGAANWAAVAPGRVNLIGDHTDYSGGLAMPMAVNLYTVAAAAPAKSGDNINIRSSGQAQAASFACGSIPTPQGDWADYLRGVYAGYMARGIGVPPMDIMISGNLPIGAGLSSSASLEICFALLIEAISGHTLNAADRAALCQKAEHDYAGVPCGILDQSAIANARAGHAMLLDCRSLEFEYLPMSAAPLLAVVDSGVRHQLADGGYADRLREVRAAEAVMGKSLRDCDAQDLQELTDSTLQRRARHVLSENQRVRAFAGAIRSTDFAEAGRILFASHQSLAEDFAVSCAELDALVALAAEAGALGARMTGGGFGGSMVCLLEPSRGPEIEEHIRSNYRGEQSHAAFLRWVTPASGPWAGPWPRPVSTL